MDVGMVCGIDLLEIERMKKSMESPRFMERVFSKDELQLFEKKGKSAPQSAAANFCAKEAFAKALGTGIRGFSLHEVGILRDGQGKPYFQFTGRAAQLVEESGLCFCVSLTHSDFAASAVVIGEEIQK